MLTCKGEFSYVLRYFFFILFERRKQTKVKVFGCTSMISSPDLSSLSQYQKHTANTIRIKMNADLTFISTIETVGKSNFLYS